MLGKDSTHSRRPRTVVAAVIAVLLMGWTTPAGSAMAEEPAPAVSGQVSKSWVSAPTDTAFLPSGRMLVAEVVGLVSRISMYAGSAANDPWLSRTGAGSPIVYSLDTIRSAGTTYVLACVANRDDERPRKEVVRYRVERTKIIFDRTLIRYGIGDTAKGEPCALTIGPDRKVWVATGDADRLSLPQKPGSLNGKVLRFTIRGTVPADNPSGTRVFTLGHGDVRSITFDAARRPYVVEPGPGHHDEINYLRAGFNFGYPCYVGHGTEYRMVSGCGAPEDYRRPAWTSPTPIEPAGGGFVSGPAWMGWRNDLIVDGIKTTDLRRFRFNAQGTHAELEQTIPGAEIYSKYGDCGRAVYVYGAGVRYQALTGALVTGGERGICDPDEYDLGHGDLIVRILPAP